MVRGWLAVRIIIVRRIKLFELCQYLLVAVCDFLLVKLVKFNGLLQAEQLLRAVVAVQGTGIVSTLTCSVYPAL